MRGEYRPGHGEWRHRGELPPRARRIPRTAVIFSDGGGTTSACAENTPRPEYWPCHARNYLRVRGEYSHDTLRMAEAMELPPRARRIHPVDIWHTREAGTTSACAENTPEPRASYLILGNYLRVRGEYTLRLMPSFVTTELPPRARRILTLTEKEQGVSGTTSACAENTYTMLKAVQAGVELPPRARRILEIVDELTGGTGTTSACAENTSNSPSSWASIWNYLRVRGEYLRHVFALVLESELPPRARRIPGRQWQQQQ